jgi:hypothetical protein
MLGRSGLYRLQPALVCRVRATIKRIVAPKKLPLQWTPDWLKATRTDECVIIKYAWNIKGKDSNLKARSSDLDALSSLCDVPEGNRVYPSCPHSVAVMIVVQYVDNSGIRYNCRELVDEFYAAVRDDGRIDLNFVGGLTWWLSVRYTYDLSTGAVSADQEAFVDKLLEQY